MKACFTLLLIAYMLLSYGQNKPQGVYHYSPGVSLGGETQLIFKDATYYYQKSTCTSSYVDEGAFKMNGDTIQFISGWNNEKFWGNVRYTFLQNYQTSAFFDSLDITIINHSNHILSNIILRSGEDFLQIGEIQPESKITRFIQKSILKKGDEIVLIIRDKEFSIKNSDVVTIEISALSNFKIITPINDKKMLSGENRLFFIDGNSVEERFSLKRSLSIK